MMFLHGLSLPEVWLSDNREQKERYREQAHSYS